MCKCVIISSSFIGNRNLRLPCDGGENHFIIMKPLTARV
jgi:hypothetical protein